MRDRSHDMIKASAQAYVYTNPISSSIVQTKTKVVFPQTSAHYSDFTRTCKHITT